MRALTFSKRNLKEILRDPLSLIFGIGFPVVLMTAMHFLSKSIEGMPNTFSISAFAPGMDSKRGELCLCVFHRL